MTTVSTATYQEELYQIPSRVLIVLSRNWNEISDEEKTTLSKILAAVKLNFAKVHIITRKAFTPDELSAYAPSKIISFGASLKTSSKLYENLPFGSGSIISAEDFPLLDDAKKKSLWLALRQMFGI